MKKLVILLLILLLFSCDFQLTTPYLSLTMLPQYNDGVFSFDYAFDSESSFQLCDVHVMQLTGSGYIDYHFEYYQPDNYLFINYFTEEPVLLADSGSIGFGIADTNLSFPPIYEAGDYLLRFSLYSSSGSGTNELQFLVKEIKFKILSNTLIP